MQFIRLIFFQTHTYITSHTDKRSHTNTASHTDRSSHTDTASHTAKQEEKRVVATVSDIYKPLKNKKRHLIRS